MTAQAGDTFSFSPAAEKQQLRRLLRERRKSIPVPHRHHSARQAALRLLKLRRLRSAKRIGVYLAIGSELDTAPLINALWNKGVRLYAPAIGQDRRMRFLPLPPRSRTRRDALRIPRPLSNRAQLPAHRLDVVVVPLVGFDGGGRRLGAGGGFYDRALAGRINRSSNAWLVGYAFEEQRLSRVPAEPWDVRLNAIVTERTVYWRQ